MTTALALTTLTDLTTAEGRAQAEKTASQMAREFREATAEIRRLGLALSEQCRRLKDAFGGENVPRYLADFDVRLSYAGDHYIDPTDPTRMLEVMKRRAWETLVDRLGIKNVMSVANRKTFEDQLKSGELPEISEETILSVICGLASQSRDFAKEAVKEVFDILRPRGHWGGEYKTNDAFRVGRKVILPGNDERQLYFPPGDD